jgi:hypothetical protein
VSNCLFYAVARWWREGGWLATRRSVFGWWLHVIWLSPDLTHAAEFTTFHKFPRWCPPLVFRGYVREWSLKSDD